MNEFSQWLRTAMQEYALTSPALANVSGLSRSSIGMYSRGRACPPERQELLRAAVATLTGSAPAVEPVASATEPARPILTAPAAPVPATKAIADAGPADTEKLNVVDTMARDNTTPEERQENLVARAVQIIIDRLELVSYTDLEILTYAASRETARRHGFLLEA